MDTIQSFAKYLKIDTSGLFYKPINQYLLNDYNLPLYEKLKRRKCLLLQKFIKMFG